MNPTTVWLWTGSIVGAVSILTFILLQSAVMRWQRQTLPGEARTTRTSTRDKDAISCSATFALIAVIGWGAMFLMVKDTAWAMLSVIGTCAVIPYAFLQQKQDEAQSWKTRSQVAQAMDEIQVLAVSHRIDSILDAYPWLEQMLKRNSVFQSLNARLIDLLGQGLALRGSNADMESIAREMDSGDLIQFLRRLNPNGNRKDEREICIRAAKEIAEHIRLDAEIIISQMSGQAMWFWLGLLVLLITAVLIPLGAQ